MEQESSDESVPVESGGAIAREEVTLPWTGAAFVISRPAEIDSLLDRVAGDPEQNLPYWAEIWPSGIALADLLTQQPKLVSGRRVLEVGCGLGVTALAASRAGAHLTVSDYSPDALELCRTNLRHNDCRDVETVAINWRAPEAVTALLSDGPFPAVLAADVLYESRDVEPLLEFFSRVVSPAGLLIIAEPGRAVARRFMTQALESEWHGESIRHDGPWPDPKDAGVTVTIHFLRR